jgi:type I restriction enzyme S subunit
MSKQWPRAKLGEVLRRVERFEPREVLTEYPFAGTYSFARGIFVGERKLGSTFALPKVQRIRTGDFIYCKIMAWEGAFGIAPSETDNCVMSGAFVVYELNRNLIDQQFLDYYFKVPAHWQSIGSQSSGTNVRRQSLHPTQFECAEIPLPSVPEQRRIVARVEELAGQIQEARGLRHQAAEEANALSHAARRMVLSSARQPEQPKLKQIAELRYGISAPISNAIDPALGHPIIRMANVSLDGDLDLSDMRYIPVSAKEQTQFSLQPGDLLLNWRSGSAQHVGKTAIFDREGDYVFASFLLRIRPVRDKVLPEFLKYTLNFMRADGVFLDAQRFQVNTKLNASEFGEFGVSVPPIPEQRRILPELDALQAQVDALKRLQTETATELDALLPAILDRAFKGEL